MESGTATGVNVPLVVLLIACAHWEVLFLTGHRPTPCAAAHLSAASARCTKMCLPTNVIAYDLLLLGGPDLVRGLRMSRKDRRCP
jgi:hypothetical protein